MLREVNKYYEVAVFTASHEWYADEILNYIDKTGELF
jgi:TFIIF-interacting CTD phosphatase-like protein